MKTMKQNIQNGDIGTKNAFLFLKDSLLVRKLIILLPTY